MEAIGITLLIFIIILLIWNLWNIRRYKQAKHDKEEYYELNAKLNFITALGSVFLLLGGYFGWTSIEKMDERINAIVDKEVQKRGNYMDSSFHNVEKKSNDSITEAVKKMDNTINNKVIDEVQKKKKNIDITFDSLIKSKDILKAGIYIVNDLVFKADSAYKFDELKTFDNKKLPKFSNSPKLIINTNTGENLRIKKVTDTYFILAEPMYKYTVYVAEQENPNYPKRIKFDVWIADYKTN